MPDIRINVKSYIERLQFIESRKPEPQRKELPTDAELADAIGVHPTNYSRMVNNKKRESTLTAIGVIMGELEKRGFNVELSDLLEVVRDSDN